MVIEIKLAYDQPEAIKALFSEYTALLIKNDPSFKNYLEQQNYEAELEHLDSKYGLPDNRLYLIYVDQAVAGCVGLRKMDQTRCEMKRLYVRPEFRGLKLSKRLLATIIEDAKAIGYQTMYLDTLPFLQTAILLYQKAGFQEISAYNNSPMDTSIYMALDLTAHA